MTTVHMYQNNEYLRSFDVDGATYQDLITNIIKSGGESGRIYDLNLVEVDYNTPRTLSEIYYIIPRGIINEVEIRDARSKNYYETYRIQYRSEGTVRDIYNAVIAEGLSYPKILFNNIVFPLERELAPYNPSNYEFLLALQNDVPY